MGEKIKAKRIESPQSIGFVACYKGQTIASAKSFDILINNTEVKQLFGKRNFIIKHTVPEGMLAVY